MSFRERLSKVLTTEQMAALKDFKLEDLFPHDTVVVTPKFICEMTSYKKEIYFNLEDDPEYVEKFRKLSQVLTNYQITNLRWLVNRAYKMGYNQGYDDNNNKTGGNNGKQNR